MDLQPPKLDVTQVLAQSGNPQILALSCRERGLSDRVLLLLLLLPPPPPHRLSAEVNALNAVVVVRMVRERRMMRETGFEMMFLFQEGRRE
jgi:hypothetical protein